MTLTVAELITELQKYPADAIVMCMHAQEWTGEVTRVVDESDNLDYKRLYELPLDRAVIEIVPD